MNYVTPVELASRHTRGFSNEARMVDVEVEGSFTRRQISAELDALYRLTKAGKERVVAQRLLRILEGELRAENFDVVGQWLRTLDVARIGAAALLSAVTITLYAQDNLSERTSFLQRAERYLRATLGYARAEKLLASRR